MPRMPMEWPVETGDIAGGRDNERDIASGVEVRPLTPERVTFWFRAGYLDALAGKPCDPPGGERNNQPYMDGFKCGEKIREEQLIEKSS